MKRLLKTAAIGIALIAAATAWHIATVWPRPRHESRRRGPMTGLEV